MPTLQNKLLPFRDYDEHEVLNLFSLNGTGLAGTFVAFETHDPSNADGWTTQAVGASYDGVTSLRYEVKAKVKVATSGLSKYEVAGITLFDTREVDNNGLLLKFNPQRKAELQCVLSGEAVPVLKRGLITLSKDAYEGTPTVGNVGVIGNAGKVLSITPGSLTTATGATGWKADHVIGRFISSSGSQHGGFALFEINV